MWVSRAAWQSMQIQHEAALNMLLDQQRALAEQQRILHRLEWTVKALRADLASDWADDNRRTTVLPVSGDT